MNFCRTVRWALISILLSAPVVAQDQAGQGEAKATADDQAESDPGKKEAPVKPEATPDAKAAAPAAAEQPKAASVPGPGKSSGADAASSSSTSVDGSTYVVRLRDLEARVDELKEQIRRSHTRLSLLSDTILSGGVGGARAEIRFQNDLSNAFRLTRALFVLDGAVQYNKQDDTGALASQKEIPIFNGSIPPGDHTLQVLIQLRGHGYGVFSYLRGYRFEAKSNHSFTVTEGKTIELTAVAWEKGGVTTPLEQRPDIRFVERIRSGSGPAGAKPGGSKNKAKGNVSTKISVGAGGK